MINFLALKSSILGDYSSSSKLIDELLAKYTPQQAIITEHDLAEQPLPVLDGEIAMAMRSPEQLNDKQRDALALSDKLISELVASDLLVIAAPMYNFMIPTQLKNWIDLVARAGKTFSYTEQGPQGLISGTRAIIVTTRGGMHKEQGTDQQVPYLKTVLNFMGISDIEVVYAESLAMGPETAELNLEQARKQLSVFTNDISTLNSQS
ncbi:(Acyl-carrier-protein) phosphodiesterase [Psychromonas ingrahamii 37]|uniref:FMN-dependent NADH:quinone oxidoreductase n=1 Tax=Psychromonas ingrahamii (strain DSM 17664 / CCUG 51855 / 37) TaxID=357804 RepID=AZOR_PSYIN|nr:FMN-dependent NADH-azoreductase [Psychromonas ingrahamii]A1SUA7.1 RecName: Full=FMN-dependent NADH:quinone oxidoreductase; AltName: Full=Azo-dye reductase; AltName: Full=FMN-dependent NADH-azo compound oxidoreductase; AltName: Full=FMN-dependent NADH-azoreductase [Psychromonas ingrahamii 37]ABM03072.1 (Acyl-carrier-protein) phosphodiesterase [Psychromonas ingrahamii 37]